MDVSEKTPGQASRKSFSRVHDMEVIHPWIHFSTSATSVIDVSATYRSTQQGRSFCLMPISSLPLSSYLFLVSLSLLGGAKELRKGHEEERLGVNMSDWSEPSQFRIGF